MVLDQLSNFTIYLTIGGLLYILSPVDFIPETWLGPIGLVDDLLVFVVIMAAWIIDIGIIDYMNYFSNNMIASVAFAVGVLAVAIFAIKNARGRRRQSQRVVYLNTQNPYLGFR